MADHILWSGVATNSLSSDHFLDDATTSFIGFSGLDATLIVQNLSDGSSSNWVDTISNHRIQTTPLTGGRTNTWDDGDIYQFVIGSPFISSDLDIEYNISASFGFAVRVIDARWQARVRMYEVQRRGVIASYKNAYEPLPQSLDPYHGNADLTKEPFKIDYDNPSQSITSAFMQANPEVRNFGVLFGPTHTIRLMYVQPTEQSALTPFGMVAQGNVLIGAPLSYPFRRMDVFKIHDKIWQVADIPTFEYWQNKEIIGYQLLCVPLKHQQISW